MRKDAPHCAIKMIKRSNLTKAIEVKFTLTQGEVMTLLRVLTEAGQAGSHIADDLKGYMSWEISQSVEPLIKELVG